MRKILVSAAVATAALIAVPAAAQPGYGYDQRYDNRYDQRYDRRGPDRRAIFELEREVRQVEQRIIRSQRQLSRREFNSLMREVGTIRTRLDRASYRGLSGREFGAIRAQINRLEQRLRVERRDYDRRPDRRW